MSRRGERTNGKKKKITLTVLYVRKEIFELENSTGLFLFSYFDFNI